MSGPGATDRYVGFNSSIHSGSASAFPGGGKPTLAPRIKGTNSVVFSPAA